MGSAFEAALARRSRSKVTDDTPSHAELIELLGAAGRVADHSSLRPWRVIALRGSARARLGRALARAAGRSAEDAGKYERKAERAPLIIAVVYSPKKSSKVPSWEQEAVASGVAHMLSLLLDEAGWGVFWRTDPNTRSKRVAAMHDLKKRERLLGWLYVGGVPENAKPGRRSPVPAEKLLTELD